MSVAPKGPAEIPVAEQIQLADANSLLEQRYEIAVIIPCFNEAHSIAEVVHGFKSVLPSARIFVFDNNSTDETVVIARAAGALIRREMLQGKGNVVRRMFADVDADAYVMADGDATYDPSYAAHMVNRLFKERLDMVVGTRVPSHVGVYRPGHQFGNRLLTSAVANLFGERFSDILSGYRVFSRRFVKSFPAMSSGFEIETELTIHALELQVPVAEVATPYRIRVAGSNSKLRTYVDGFRIFRLIVFLYKRTPFSILFSNRGRPRYGCAGPRHSANCNVHQNRPRAAPANRHFNDGPGSSVRPEFHRRDDTRHRDESASRNAPSRLSGCTTTRLLSRVRLAEF